VVYFANARHHKAAHGHVLADIIVAPGVKLEHGLNWFFQKFGFSRDVKLGWEVKEKTNMAQIGKYLSAPSRTKQWKHEVDTVPASAIRSTKKILSSQAIKSNHDCEEKQSSELSTPFSITLKR
jgi:hypothetical protein